MVLEKCPNTFGLIDDVIVYAKKTKEDHDRNLLKQMKGSGSIVERCVPSIKSAIKKAKSSSLDIHMVLLCLRTILIDHIIPSSGELLFNRKLFSNITKSVL